jgi:hypothetical protein
VRKADKLPPSRADITESGSLKLQEPPGPDRPVIGMLYLFFIFGTYTKHIRNYFAHAPRNVFCLKNEGEV